MIYGILEIVNYNLLSIQLTNNLFLLNYLSSLKKVYKYTVLHVIVMVIYNT